MRIAEQIALFVTALTLFGCATTMSERASHVQIISAEQAKQYEFVSNVSSSSGLTGIARHTGYQNALNEVLDKAAAEGANFIVLDQGSGASYWSTSEIVRATAYKRKP